MKEHHLQVVDPSNPAIVSPFAFRETSWNRPISLSVGSIYVFNI